MKESEYGWMHISNAQQRCAWQKTKKTKNKKKKKKKTAHVSVEDNVEREDLLHKTYLVLGVFFWIKISCERCRFL